MSILEDLYVICAICNVETLKTDLEPLILTVNDEPVCQWCVDAELKRMEET